MDCQLNPQGIPQHIHGTDMVPMAMGIHQKLYINAVIPDISKNFLPVVPGINNNTFTSFLILQHIAVFLNRTNHQSIYTKAHLTPRTLSHEIILQK